MEPLVESGKYVIDRPKREPGVGHPRLAGLEVPPVEGMTTLPLTPEHASRDNWISTIRGAIDGDLGFWTQRQNERETVSGPCQKYFFRGKTLPRAEMSCQITSESGVLNPSSEVRVCRPCAPVVDVRSRGEFQPRISWSSEDRHTGRLRVECEPRAPSGVKP